MLKLWAGGLGFAVLGLIGVFSTLNPKPKSLCPTGINGSYFHRCQVQGAGFLAMTKAWASGINECAPSCITGLHLSTLNPNWVGTLNPKWVDKRSTH